jgi:hypothetical protein
MKYWDDYLWQKITPGNQLVKGFLCLCLHLLSSSLATIKTLASY